MELSPQAIRTANFRLVKKGYDPDQVDSFREQVADVVEAVHNQATSMEARARAAVAKLQEAAQNSGHQRQGEPESTGDKDVIGRTLLLAQRTADAAIAQARTDAEAIAAESRHEAEQLLENARALAAKTVEDARAEARRAAEGDRVSAENDVQALLARRDFLLSDVDQLEQYIQAQRERLHDAATGLQDLADRVPGGLGDMRRPLLSASADQAATPVATGSVRADAREVVVPDQVADEQGAPEIDVDLVWEDPAEDNDDSGVDAGVDAGAETTVVRLPDRPRGANANRPSEARSRQNPRSGDSTLPFSDPLDQDSVWRLLDEEVANVESAEGRSSYQMDEVTTEVPVQQPMATETFRVSGDELQ